MRLRLRAAGDEACLRLGSQVEESNQHHSDDSERPGREWSSSGRISTQCPALPCGHRAENARTPCNIADVCPDRRLRAEDREAQRSYRNTPAARKELMIVVLGR